MDSRLIKRIAALLLVVTLAFSSVQTAFAAEETLEEDITESISVAPEVPDIPEEPQEPETPEETEDTIVARVSLFAAMYVFPVSGHTWIYVENLTDIPMMVGLYEVPAGQGVSVGTFSFSVWDGWGIYYNLEAYRENRNDNIDDCWSITLDFTRSQVEALSESIRKYPNMWDIFVFNCTFFSLSIWNANTKYFFIPFIIPAIPWLEVMIAGAKKGATQMYYPTTDQVFRQRGTGNSARLEPVGDATLRN